MHPLRLLALALLLPACAETPAELLESHPLSIVSGVDSSSAVGITVAPDTGITYVLDPAVGIIQVDLSGEGGQFSAEPVNIAPIGDWPVASTPPRSGWTDIVALGADRFAVTAQTQGFLLDLDEQTLTQHFCYVPGFVEEEDMLPVIDQITDSVTYDLDRDLLYAQPETFDPATGEVSRADIGMFDGATGQDLSWTEIQDTEFPAGGIALDGDGNLVLAYGDRLETRSLDDGEVSMADTDLSQFELQSVAGMARDPATGHYLLIDPASDQLVRIAR